MKFGVGTAGISKFHNGDEKNLKFVGDNTLFGRARSLCRTAHSGETVTLHYGLSYRP